MVTTAPGHSLPPEGPHTITVHVHGWDKAMRFREGDMALFQSLKSIYPRFAPWNSVMALTMALGQKLGLPEGYAVLPFVHPDMFAAAKDHAFSHHRTEGRLEPAELLFRVVDVAGVRLYCVAYPAPKMAGIIGLWQNPGLGVSSRLAEELLKHVDGAVEVPLPETARVTDDGDLGLASLPSPTYLPETEAHRGVRGRIVELLQWAPVVPHEKEAAEEDVYLYPTGMAAIYRTHESIMRVKRGKVVALGALFHSTYHLFEEAPNGFKHFGQCDAASGVMDKVEALAQEEQKAGKGISYVFAEFPSNPLCVSVDLKRLRSLADKYNFLVVIDDTVGSFCNIDVLPAVDILLTSLTKSFSGYADVMGGSAVLNPSGVFYQWLRSAFGETFRNELFAGDAAQLLSNSADYLARSAVLNRNANAVAALLQAEVGKPGSPVVRVLHPATVDTRANYEAVMRPATADLTPGYGCLVSPEFGDKDQAKAFYDHLDVHHGPHLGAHRTLAVPFNELVWGKEADKFAYHIEYGLRGEQIRIAVGLEDEAELLEVVRRALGAVEGKKGEA